MSLYVYEFRRKVVPSVMVFILLVLSSCNYFKEKIHPASQEDRTVELPPKAEHSGEEVTSRHTTDSVTRVIAEKKAFEKILTDSLMSIGLEADTETNFQHHYYIIVGSFDNTYNAKILTSDYTKKGYRPKVLTISKNVGQEKYLVSIKSFDDYQSASLFLNDFKANGTPSAWIYSGK